MIVAFRECLEMLLIIVPLLVYLRKVDRPDLLKYIYSGCTLGIFTTFATGGLILGQVTSLKGYSKDFFEGSMMLFIAGLVLYNIVWIGKQNKNITLDINKKDISNLTGTSLFLLSFLTIFRESLEIIMFLVPFIYEPISKLEIGISTGIVISLILGYLIFKTALKLNINIIFSLISLTLIFIGGMLFGEGLYGVLPFAGQSIQTSGQWVFTIPLLLLFSKREIKRYIKKG